MAAPIYMFRSSRFICRICPRISSKLLQNCSQGPKTARSLSDKSSKDDDSQKATVPLSSLIAAAQERRAGYDKLLKSEEIGYERSRRHLANMMGEDPEHFTQEDIDKAIKYLLPSGLFESGARPVLKPPQEYYPPQKAAQFGADGRPFNCFFYTGKANYYNLMYDTAKCLNSLITKENTLIQAEGKVTDIPKINLVRSEWIKQNTVETMLVEKIKDDQYERFISLLERIIKQPFAVEAQEYVMRFRKTMEAVLSKEVVEPLKKDDSGRYYSFGLGRRKTANASVILRDKGEGKVTINGEEFIEKFKRVYHREDVLFPLNFVNMLDRFDVECEVEGGGLSGQSGAIRLGIAKALQSYLDEHTVEKMRQAGLLTKDPRINERQKPGQKGARKKFTWKKR